MEHAWNKGIEKRKVSQTGPWSQTLCKLPGIFRKASGSFREFHLFFLSSEDELVGWACIGQGNDSQGQVIQKYVPPTLQERKPLSSYRESEFDET
jgi:hypothetical protein